MNYEVLGKITIVFFSLLFLASVFVAIKILYEINRFDKINSVINDLVYWKSYFFLKKFLELSALSEKQPKYHFLFQNLFKKYQQLISDQTIEWIEQYIVHLETESKVKFKINENERSLFHHQKFTEISEQNSIFSNQLKNILVIENYCLDQVYKFEIIHDLILDEINKTTLKVNLKFTNLLSFWKDLQQQVKEFKEKIFDISEEKMESELDYLFTVFKTNIVLIIDYLKIILLYQNSLPQLKTTIFEIMKKQLTNLDDNQLINQFEKTYATEIAEIDNQIKEFYTPKLGKKIINLYQTLTQQLKQLENFSTIQNYLKIASAELENVNHEITDWYHTTFEELTNAQSRALFSTNQQQISDFNDGYKQFKSTYEKWQNLYQKRKDTLFFEQQIALIKKSLNVTVNFLEQNLEINQIFLQDRQRIERNALTIMNIKTFCEKIDHPHFQVVYQQDLKEIINQFMRITTPSDYQPKLAQQERYKTIFSELEVKVTKLKKQIEKEYLLSQISQLLFVKVNKLRFSSEKITNQILNAEMLYLKGRYLNVVEQLLEVYEATTNY